MKKIILLTFFILGMFLAKAQVPNSFKYQAVVRDATGTLISNKLIALKISILEGSATGSSVFSERFEYATNEYGIVSVNIGTGVTLQGVFSNINWGINSYYLQVEVDIDGNDNYQFMGASQILAVPYAMYALNVQNTDDADADPSNEIQTISKNGDLVTLSNAGGSFTDAVDDADADPNNEIQDLSLNDNVLRITNNPNSTPINLSAYQGVNTDEQTLSTNIIGSTVELTIGGGTGGNTVSFQLPSDFVSRASGGTFSGPIYASNLSGVNTGDMTPQDIVDAYQGQYSYYLLPGDRTNLDRLSLQGAFTLSGASPVQFTSSGSTNLSLPTSGTLATQDYVAQSINTSNSLATGNIWIGVGNVATPINVATSGQIMIGNGSGIGSFPISGDATMSSNGVLTLNNSVVTAGTYFQTTVNSKGLVTGGINPTTLAGFGIVDGMSNSLSNGRILVGEGGVAEELDVRGDGQILIGNGTTITSRAISGDISLSNTGNVTINSINGNNVDLGGEFTTTNDNIILNADATGSNVTLPASGTLATQSYVNSQIGTSFELNEGFIFVGNASGDGIGVDLHGDADLASDGTITVTGIDGTVVSSTNVNNWNTAYSWGDHDGLYRPVGYVPAWSEITSNPFSFTSVTDGQLIRYNNGTGNWENWTPTYLSSESDPVFIAWDRSTGISVTATQVSDFQTNVTNNTAVIANTAKNSYPSADATKLAGIASGAEVNVNADWNATSGDAQILNNPFSFTSVINGQLIRYNNGTGNWENWTPTYLTSESDPVFSASAAQGITLANITNWNTAYTWGDHSLAGYLTSVIEVADEFTAGAGQTAFTLSGTPSVNSVVKMFVDGLRVSNTVYSVVGDAVTYSGSALTAGQRVQFDYYY